MPINRRENEGIAEHHGRGKELLAGFAAAELDKYLGKGGGDGCGHGGGGE
jgi:Protein of unknown function (DUF3759)